MIHHPIVLGAKLVLLLIIAIVLIALHGVLGPEQFRAAVVIGVVVFVLGVVGLWIFAFRALGNPNSRLGRRMVLPDPGPAGSASEGELAGMVGRRGVATSALRPAGAARFDGRRVSVVTEGDFVQSGSPVEIISVDGSRVVVRPVSGPDDSEQGPAG